MKIIKKSLIGFAFLGVLSTVASASAAGVVITNGGFTQGNANSFGVSVCNGGKIAFSGSVPVLISTNGVSQTISFSSPLAAGACGSRSVAYSTFNMSAGNSYLVQVTIDPHFTVISNDNDRVTAGSITVPGVATTAPPTATLPTVASTNTTSGGQVLGASTMSTAEHNLLLSELASAEQALSILMAEAAKQ